MVLAASRKQWDEVGFSVKVYKFYLKTHFICAHYVKIQVSVKETVGFEEAMPLPPLKM